MEEARRQVEQFKSEGDNHFLNGNYEEAINSYTKISSYGGMTVEPSFVIEKFANKHKYEELSEFLLRLNKSGINTMLHIRLLLLCYVRLNKEDKIKELVMGNTGRNVEMDRKVVIDLLMKYGYNYYAKIMSGESKFSETEFKIVMSDENAIGRFRTGLLLLEEMDSEKKDMILLDYLPILVEKRP